MTVTLHLGDCLDVMRSMPDASVDAVVTDPPAGIAFMGKEWDDARTWQYKIAGHGFTDGGKRVPAPAIGTNSANPTCRDCGKRQRTWKGGPVACECSSPRFDNDRRHREARDIFVSFLTAALAECLRVAKPGARMLCWAIPRTSHWTGTAIEDAGWIIEDRISHLFGQGFPKAKSKLKPACEDWWLARKPSKNVPPLNIDACRIEAGERPLIEADRGRISGNTFSGGLDGSLCGSRNTGTTSLGRWPANVVLDESAAELLDEQTGTSVSRIGKPRSSSKPGEGYGMTHTGSEYDDSGGASRFYYVAKASRKDRDEGNTHPTVKPTDLMRWLVRLIAKPGDVVLDPFTGSGSTGKACGIEGIDFIGIERDPAYFAIAERRINAARHAMPLLMGS